MKTMWKMMGTFVLALCVSATLLCGVSAQADPVDLMPTAEDGYTIVEGDGTVSLDGGVMTLVNNGDGDLRVTINNANTFDMSTLNGLHMHFTADMPFKMAYYIVSDVENGGDDWLATTVDYLDAFEVDALADRSPAGEYDVEMNLADLAVSVTDQSAVHFDQFIILVTGKGSFTVNTVELCSVESVATEDADGETTDDTPADTEESDDEEVVTTTTKAADKDDQADKGEASGNPVLVIVLIVIAVIIVAAIVIILVKKRKV